MFSSIIYEFSTTRFERNKDRIEITSLYSKYGEVLVDELKSRRKSKSLSLRDRRHWARLLSALKYHGHPAPHLQPIDQHQTV